MNMHRLYILLCSFFVAHSSLFVSTASAHGRVEEAFRALLAVNRHPKPYDDSGKTPAATSLLISDEHLPLIMDVYKTIEEEHTMRTVWFRQDLGSACANGIELQGRDFQFAGQYNNVLGGFSDPSTTPTTYRWYYLAWRPVPEQKSIVGYIVITQEEANTLHPNIQEPQTPSYQTLLEAIETFKSAGGEASSRHADFEMRAAATGQWIYRWKTFGFNLPVSAEHELIAPLYRAFLEVRPRAYRFLNKRAGETAEDVQIVVNHTGRTIGLGLQTDWNIIYAYFNDEDFPQNRYVYALWYKLDVPSQRIVGELIEVNTLRPNGGQVTASVQMNVPPYLYRIRQPLATNTQGVLNNVPNDPTPKRQEEKVRYLGTSNYRDARSNDEAVRIILNNPGDIFSNQWLTQGFDREAMELEYRATVERLRSDRVFYSEELRQFTEIYNTSTADARTFMQASLDSVKADFRQQASRLNARRPSLSRDDYERQTTALFEHYRQELDSVTVHYKATVDALGKSYEAVVSAMAARHPTEDILLTADGDLTPFGQRLFTQMTNAYQGKVSSADHELAERIRLFVRAVSTNVNKRTYDTMLTTLRKMTKRGNRHARGRETIKQSINILTLQQQ